VLTATIPNHRGVPLACGTRNSIIPAMACIANAGMNFQAMTTRLSWSRQRKMTTTGRCARSPWSPH